MIIGNGLVGSKLRETDWSDDFVFFASGVSKSKSNSIPEFIREEKLLLSTIKKYPNKITIYFSTCSIYDTQLMKSPYVQHKLNMENLLIEHSEKYRIIRVSNLVGRSQNKETVLNFLVNAIQKNTPFELWNEIERNLLDINHFSELLKILLSDSLDNKIHVLYNKYSISVKKVVSEIERFLNKKGKYKIINGKEKSQPKIIYPYSKYIDSYFPYKDNSSEYLQELLKNYYDKN